jgi:PAS domain-containing protein
VAQGEPTSAEDLPIVQRSLTTPACGAPYAGGVQRPIGDLRAPTTDEERHLLALVEAQVGPLLDLLPVPLLVTSASGRVLRANPSAVALLGPREARVERPIDEVLRRRRDLSVRVRILRHDGERVRLYVLQNRPPM